MLVLAGSIMGVDISVAAEELRAVGVPIIALKPSLRAPKAKAGTVHR